MPQRRALGVDEESKQVKVKAVMESVQFQTGEKFYAIFTRKAHPFQDIAHRVMVSEGNGPQTFVPGHLEDFPGRMLSIRGSVGVNVQVNHRMVLLEKRKNYNHLFVFIVQILTHKSPRSIPAFRGEFGVDNDFILA